MPYCKHCGHTLSEGTAFCPECGTPVKTAPAPSSPPAAAKNLEKSPRSRGNIGIIIAIVLVVAALIAAAAIFLPRLLSPGEDHPDDSADRSIPSNIPDGSTVDQTAYDVQFAALHRELLDGILAPLSRAADRIPQHLSTDLTLTLDVNSPSLRPYLNGTYLTLRMDAQKEALLMDGELTLMGMPILTGFLTLEGDTVGFCLPEADGAYYTLPLINLLSALSDVSIDNLNLSGLSGTAAGLTGRQLEHLGRTYLDIFLTLATPENVTFDGEGRFSTTHLYFGAGSHTGGVYTCTPKAEETKAMLLALADQVEKDQDLRVLLASMEDMEQQLGRFVQDLRSNAEQYAQNLEDNHTTWTLCVSNGPDETTVLLLESDQNTAGLEHHNSGRQVNTVLYSQSDGQGAYFENRYTSTPGRVDGVFSVHPANGNDVSLDYSFEINGSAPFIPYGSYDLVTEGQHILLEVEPAQEGAVNYTLTVPVDPAEADADYDTAILTITATQGGTAQAPTIPPTDISGYSSRQLKSLFDQLGDSLVNYLTLAVIRAMMGSFL